MGHYLYPITIATAVGAVLGAAAFWVWLLFGGDHDDTIFGF